MGRRSDRIPGVRRRRAEDPPVAPRTGSGRPPGLIGLALIVGVALAGCSAPKEERHDPQGAPAPLPETRQDSLALEGLQEPMTFVLFDGRRQGLAIPFTAYVPEDIEGRRLANDAVRFVARFDGETNEDAYLEIRFLPAGTSEEQARARVIEEARQGAVETRQDAPRRFPWSLVEREYARGSEAAGWRIGMVAAARRQDRFVLVTMQYPETWEEGFVPRAVRVLEEWRWGDTRDDSRPGF